MKKWLVVIWVAMMLIQLWWKTYPTYDTCDVTGRGPDGPYDQISAGYQVLVVELSYTLSLLPWGAHAWDRGLGLSSSSASQL